MQVLFAIQAPHLCFEMDKVNKNLPLSAIIPSVNINCEHEYTVMYTFASCMRVCIYMCMYVHI